MNAGTEVPDGTSVTNAPASGVAVKKRVLMVADCSLTRRGLAAILQTENDLVCGGEVASLDALMAALQTQRPDLVLLDVRVRGENTLHLVRSVKEQCPEIGRASCRER